MRLSSHLRSQGDEGGERKNMKFEREKTMKLTRRIFNSMLAACSMAAVSLTSGAMAADMPAPFDKASDVKIALVRYLSTGDFFQAYLAGVEAQSAALELNRGTIGNQVMYFETGQGSALSSNAHHGVDQQTMEVRAYAVARHFDPFLVNSVVGFIGPEYLYDGKQITRAGLEDHFCGKLMGLPMGMDVCYTNHAEADQDDMDNLLTLLGVAGCNFFMGVPGADDIMLNYQSTSFHDALYLRQVLKKKPAPEFENWLLKMGILNEKGIKIEGEQQRKLLKGL